MTLVGSDNLSSPTTESERTGVYLQDSKSEQTNNSGTVSDLSQDNEEAKFCNVVKLLLGKKV